MEGSCVGMVARFLLMLLALSSPGLQKSLSAGLGRDMLALGEGVGGRVIGEVIFSGPAV